MFYFQKIIELGIGVYRTHNAMSSIERAINEYGEFATKVAIRFFQFLVVWVSLLTTSCMAFGILYLCLVPRRLHDRPVYLDYQSVAQRSAKVAGVQQPFAKIDFLTEYTQWEPTNLTKASSTSKKLLKTGQKYTIIAEFVMPESEANQALGVFMVDLALKTPKDELLAVSHRPALLQYRSPVANFLEKLFLWPFFSIGLLHERQTLQVFCFDSFQETNEYPMTKAEIRISTDKAQVYSASLVITAQLSGLSYLLQHHFWVTAVGCIACIMCMELCFCAIIYLWFKLVYLDDLEPGSRSTTPTNEPPRPQRTDPQVQNNSQAQSAEQGTNRSIANAAGQNTLAATPLAGLQAEDNQELFTSGQRYPAERALTGQDQARQRRTVANISQNS